MEYLERFVEFMYVEYNLFFLFYLFIYTSCITVLRGGLNVVRGGLNAKIIYCHISFAVFINNYKIMNTITSTEKCLWRRSPVKNTRYTTFLNKAELKE